MRTLSYPIAGAAFSLAALVVSVAKGQTGDNFGALLATRFAIACAADHPPANAVASFACNPSPTDPAVATRYLAALPDGGDRGMPDTWSSLAAARAHFVLAGATAWSDSAWAGPARTHRRPAIEAILHATQLNKGFIPALFLLNDLSPYPHTWAAPKDELACLEAVPVVKLPDALIPARVFLTLEADRRPAAESVVDSVLADHRDDATIAFLKSVVLAHEVPVASAWSEYLKALRVPHATDPDHWPAYEAMLVADTTERREWPTVAPQQRIQWLEDFWESRDFDAGSVPGTRWVTHQQRWIKALQQFRIAPEGGVHEEKRMMALMDVPLQPRTDPNPLWEGGDRTFLPRGMRWFEPVPPGDRIATLVHRTFDDRGVVFLRHGAPTRVVTYRTKQFQYDYVGIGAKRGPDCPPGRCPSLEYAIWFYAFGNGPMATLPFGQMTTATPGMWAFDFPRGGDLMTPCQVDARFCASMLSAGISRSIREESNRALAKATVTDDVPAPVKRDAGLLSQAIGLPGGNVLVVWAVPADSVVPRGGREVTMRLAALVGKPGAGVVSRLDSVRTFRLPDSVSRGRYLTGWLEVQAPPGTYDLTLTAFTADSTAGDIRHHSNVVTEPFDGTKLRIGTPILGREDARLSFSRHGERIALNPTNAWHKDQPATLYYEADGMVPGRRYETRIEFWSAVRKESKPKLTLTFREMATQKTPAMHRVLGLQELPPGEYRLVIRIRDTETGTTTSSEGALNVAK